MGRVGIPLSGPRFGRSGARVYQRDGNRSAHCYGDKEGSHGSGIVGSVPAWYNGIGSRPRSGLGHAATSGVESSAKLDSAIVGAPHLWHCTFLRTMQEDRAIEVLILFVDVLAEMGARANSPTCSHRSATYCSRSYACLTRALRSSTPLSTLLSGLPSGLPSGQFSWRDRSRQKFSTLRITGGPVGWLGSGSAPSPSDGPSTATRGQGFRQLRSRGSKRSSARLRRRMSCLEQS